ncbi:MAG TPA: glycine--tRNA ligase subunit beta [Woeseiaceae bacterium]|nr:glycine--tRNA ligase subunit beta [Woeseiaceae bacterium]
MTAEGKAADFLVEIGTEELPPKALKELMLAFARNVEEGLARQRLDHEGVTPFASPRRLAALVTRLSRSQPGRELEQKGPPLSVAFDAQGLPTPAARAFAEKCGVPVEALRRSSTPKGEWLSCRVAEAGQSAASLLPGICEEALEKLPVPRRMRWGSSDYEFVRPVHWVLMLHGTEVIDARLLGVRAGRLTRGHRFLSTGELEVAEPASYLGVLEQAFVIAGFPERRQRILRSVQDAAAGAGGVAIGDDDLYDEVTALTEWPVALAGRFSDTFLELPPQVIIATLTGHQRYFPVRSGDGELLSAFVTVANLESRDPGRVRDGNERVVQPRLADAAFFWEQDRKASLASRRGALGGIVYQKGLGTLADKSERVASLSAAISGQLQIGASTVQRAALLAKCDLLTGMVGEFPELQGTMGRYYALGSGESQSVADAIGEQYLPRFAGDSLPVTQAGQVLAIADKLDTLAGIFSLGRKPSGNRDPFGLRRAALGLVRIVIENKLDLDLKRLIARAVELQPAQPRDATEPGGDIYDFILERMRAYYIDQKGLAPEIFEAVRVRRPVSLSDLDKRVDAVAAFVKVDAAQSLAASNKRIANILRQAGDHAYGAVDASLLEEDAEVELFDAIRSAQASVDPLLQTGAYEAVLTRLAQLRQPVDTFFDKVMVMTDDEALRHNRLALLSGLRGLFLDIADISRLSVG